MSDPIKGSATIEWSSLRVKCPKCETVMVSMEGKAYCSNTECEEGGKPYNLEVPTVDVFLRAEE